MADQPRDDMSGGATPQPYGGPPPAAGWTPPAGPSGPRAGFWRRFGGALIDGILLSVVNGLIGSAFGQSVFSFQDGTVGYQMTGMPFLLTTLIDAAYLIYFEGSSGQTIGKRVLGIRVIDFDSGSSLGYGRAALRWIGRLASALPCLLGYFWMLWDKQKQTWHDKIANSVVVPAEAYPVESWPR